MKIGSKEHKNLAKTNQEAVELISKAHKEMISKFCPVIKDYCREDCMCFQKTDTPTTIRMYIPEQDREGIEIDNMGYAILYRAPQPYCLNPLVTGVILAQS